MKDGKWIKTDSLKTWSLSILSPGAYSLNFAFSDLYLPEGAKLYIYNEDGTMVYGPLTSKQNRLNKTFLTDIIQGECVNILISVPENQKDLPILTIGHVVHGYKNIFKSTDVGGYGQSGDCTDDVACFPLWSDESDGVVQILIGTDELCSGALLNNTAEDFKPYILTAFHCLDVGARFFERLAENDTIEEIEKEHLNNWNVRFRFRHTTCDGSTIESVRTYNGADFRAAWLNTDFALAELEDNIINDINAVGEKVWLGWSRSSSSPTDGICIHHPRGDIAKLSLEYNTLSIANYNGFNNSHWKVQSWDEGVTEKGSSGAPLFDQNNRVVGQLLGIRIKF